MQEIKKPNFVKNKKLVKTTTFAIVLFVTASMILSSGVTAINIIGSNEVATTPTNGAILQEVGSASMNRYTPPQEQEQTLGMAEHLFKFHSGFNNNAVGFNGAMTWEGAMRLTAAELGGYSGWNITKINYYYYDSVSINGKVKIYHGGTSSAPGALWQEVNFTQSTAGLKETTLTTPIPITGTEEIWVSIEWQQLAAGFPFGVDAGPQVDGKGAFLYYSGAWYELQDLGLDYNWVLEAYSIGALLPNDVGVTEIIAPVGGTATGAITPKVIVENFGSEAQEDVPVEMSITAYGTPTNYWCDGFESFTLGYYDLPTGWTKQTTNPTGTWYMYQSSTTYSASTYPRIQEAGSDGNAQDESLISPVIDCSALSTVELRIPYFYFYAYTPDFANATIYVTNDSGTTWNTVASYTSTSTGAKNLDVTSYAAGHSNVQFKFRFDSPADTTLSSYWYFDYMWVGDPTVGAWGTYGDNPPLGWTIERFDNTSWDANHWYKYSSSSYDMYGSAARIAYLSPYPEINDNLTSPSINCSDLSKVILQFNCYFYSYTSYLNEGYVQVSIDGGAWQDVDDYKIVPPGSYGYSIQYEWYNGYDITALAAGHSDVKVRFKFTRPAGKTSGYWYLDNVRIHDGSGSFKFIETFDASTSSLDGSGGCVYFTNFKNYIHDNWGGKWDWKFARAPYYNNKWQNVQSCADPVCTPIEGLNMAQYYNVYQGMKAMLYTIVPIDVAAANVLKMSFWMFHDTQVGAGSIDVLASHDGITWENMGTFNRQGTVNQWEQHVIDLAGYEDDTALQIAFLGTSDYIAYMNIDDVCLFDPGLILEYSNTTYVDIGARARVEVEFAPWTPTAWHNQSNLDVLYDVFSTTDLVNDSNPANDAQSSTISIYYPFFYDVESVQILSPTANGPAQELPVKTSIKNVGQYPVSGFFANTKINELAYTTLLDEKFEGTWGPYGDIPPAGWTIINGGDTTDWDNNEWHRSTYSSYGCSGQVARTYYTSPYELRNESLITPAMNCSGLSTVTLSHVGYFYFYATAPGWGYIEGSIDNGTTWPYLVKKYDLTATYTQTYDISSWAAGQPNVKINFRYFSDVPTYYGRYWYLDNVLVIGASATEDYNASASVTDPLNPGETIELTYANWTPGKLISGIPGTEATYDYQIVAKPLYPGDANPANDIVTHVITIDYEHEVQVKEITSPSIGRLQDKFYAFEAYPTEQSIWFLSNAPGDLNTIAPSTAPDFMAAGTWADGVWYASVYGTGALYTVDPDSGAMTLVGGGGTGLNGMAYDDNTGTMYGASSTNLYTIDLGTGAQTLVGLMGASYLMIDIAIDNAGVCYGHDIVTDSIYIIDLGTGAATLLGTTGIAANYAQGMEYDKNNEVLYLAAYTSQGELYTVDVTNGHATLVGAFEGGVEVDALAIPYSGGPGPQGIDIYIQPTASVPIQSIVKNTGTFPENDLTAYSKVYEYITDPINGTLIWQDDYPDIDLNPLGEEKTIDFQCCDKLTEEGIYQLLVSLPLDDNKPNNNVKSLGIGVDDTKPESTHALTPPNPDGLNGWYVNNVKVKLEAEDPEVKGVSSGVKEIKYKLDSDPEKTYTAEFTVSSDGPHTVVYYAVDNVGNAEEQNTVEFKIDKGKPELALAYEVTGGGEMQGWTLTFTATAADEQSGMDRVEWYYNDVYQNVTYGQGPTYVWVIYHYNPDLDVTIKAIGYDLAGNNASDQIERPESHGQQQSMPNGVLKTKLNLGR